MDPFFIFSLANETDNSIILNGTNRTLFIIDVYLTRVWSYSNFLLYVFILAYNIYYLIKAPQSVPPKIFITIQLFVICAIYSFTYMLPLFNSKEAEMESEFPNFDIYNTTSPLCSAQAIFHSTTLLAMLGINLCITISCFFSFKKKKLSKKVEILLCLAAWIIPLIVCLFSLLDKEMLIDANMLCWPGIPEWRIVYDCIFCLAYLANLIVFGLIIYQIFKINKEKKWKYFKKIWLLGLILITLSLYFSDFVHSLIVNSKIVIKKNSQNGNDTVLANEESTSDSQDNSNIDSMFFILCCDILGLFTGNCLVLVYKPRFPRVLCCKEDVQGELPEFGESDSEYENENENENEMMSL